jgi:hypothetical protein
MHHCIPETLTIHFHTLSFDIHLDIIDKLTSNVDIHSVLSLNSAPPIGELGAMSYRRAYNHEYYLYSLENTDKSSITRLAAYVFSFNTI